MWDVKRVDQKAVVYCNTWNISTPSRSQFHGKSSKISWIQTGCDIHKSLVFDGKNQVLIPPLRSSTNGWSKDSIDLQLSNDPFLLKGFFTAKLLDSFSLTIGRKKQKLYEIVRSLILHNPTNPKGITKIHKTQENHKLNNSGEGQEIQDHIV